jgi:hypothetical protein
MDLDKEPAEALQSTDVRKNMLGIRAYRMALARLQRTKI